MRSQSLGQSLSTGVALLLGIAFVVGGSVAVNAADHKVVIKVNGASCTQTVDNADDQSFVIMKIDETAEWSSSSGGTIKISFPPGTDPEHPGTPFYRQDDNKWILEYFGDPTVTSDGASLTLSESSGKKFKYSAVTVGTITCSFVKETGVQVIKK